MMTPTQTLTITINRTILTYKNLTNGTITYEKFCNELKIIRDVIAQVTSNVGPEYEIILDKACMVADYAEENAESMNTQMKEVA